MTAIANFLRGKSIGDLKVQSPRREHEIGFHRRKRSYWKPRERLSRLQPQTETAKRRRKDRNRRRRWRRENAGAGLDDGGGGGSKERGGGETSGGRRRREKEWKRKGLGRDIGATNRPEEKRRWWP